MIQVTGTTLTGCILGPYYDPNQLFSIADFPILLIDGSIPVVTLNTINDTSIILNDGNIPVSTINVPNEVMIVIVGGA